MMDDWESVRASHSLHVSTETRGVLARQQLQAQAAKDPADAARTLEARLQTQPERDGALALAELSYHVGLGAQKRSMIAAMSWYRDAATLAALALADPAGSRPDVAIDIHNRALTRLIRLSQDKRTRQDGQKNWRQVLEAQGLIVRSATPYLQPDRIGDLTLADDYQVDGMEHVYRTSGLGMPLVAHRWAPKAETSDVQDQFLPRELRVGATAVLMPGAGLYAGAWKTVPSRLDLLDPFHHRAMVLGDKQVILASDRTTPLAAQVARTHFAALEWTGLFESGFERLGVDAGLYMLRPYEPGKIPIIFVHGLISSPRAWANVINELQNTAEFAHRYQFWEFLYPTGAPVPISAARLRESIAKVRATLDPGFNDPAMGQIVVVGHSMGGILSKMMAQESGLALWDAAITVPHDEFQAPTALKKGLDDALILHPSPYVSRLVFIATPHRGSPICNGPFGRTVADMVHGAAGLDAEIAEIEDLNGPNVISAEMRGQPLNSIENLRTDSPILASLDRIPIEPRVRYHSIIPLLGGKFPTDGVVGYDSSHIDGATSETIVPGTHTSQQSPHVIRELARILHQHLAETTYASPAAVPTGP
jgi:pimeloyl-ACP methyl ester carboxylesterase